MFTSPVKRVVGGGLCGLKNMGNTCYMNGIIQCLLSFPIILAALLQIKMDQYASLSHPVTCALRIFLDQLLQSSSTYSYEIFLECVQNTWMRYKDKEQQDPMEFFTYLISTIHGEILEVHCLNEERTIDNDDVVGSVVNAWMSSEKSKMTYMFGLQIVRLNNCACGHMSGVCDSPEFYLSLALPSSYTCTLQECLQLFCSETVNTCSQCGEDSVRSTLRLGRLPPILVVHLVRFSPSPFGGFIKNICRVTYDQNIDLKDFFVKDLHENTKYSLCAVTDHCGQLHSGHVTAYGSRNNRWYHFDDANVSASSTRRSLPESAYILWYQQNVEHNFIELDALSESVLRSSFPSHSVQLSPQASHSNDQVEEGGNPPETVPTPAPSSHLVDHGISSQSMDGEVLIPPIPPSQASDHNTPPVDIEPITFAEDMKVPMLIVKFSAVTSKTPKIYIESEKSVIPRFNESTKRQSSPGNSAPPKHQRMGIDAEDPLLTEHDIPGAYLDMSKLDSIKRPRLVNWLRARNLPYDDKKDILKQRIRQHHALGKSGIVDPSFEGGKWHEKKKREAWDKSGVHHNLPLPPMGAKVWNPFPTVRVPEGFTYYKILEYFEDVPACHYSTKTGVVSIPEEVPVLHVESDSDEDDTECHIQISQDLTFTDLCRRAVMSALMKGEQFLASGRVGAMSDTVKNEYYYIKAQVQASMELTIYTVQVCLEIRSGDIRYVTCCCKTQNIHRCGHIAAVLILLWKHVATGNEAVTTTGRECYWRSCPDGRDPGFVSLKQYTSHKWKIDRRNVCNYLPKKLQFEGQMSMEELQQFRNNLRTHIPSSLAMFHIGPLFDSATNSADTITEDHVLAAENCCRLIWSMTCRGKGKTGPFLLEGTEGQHLSEQWQHERRMRSTAFDSKVFLGLASGSAKKNYLRQKIWGLDKFESPAMKDGKTLEPAARKLYEKCLIEAFDPTSVIKETGSWSNTKCPTLSCSPDGLIEAELFQGEVILFEAKYLSKPHVDPHTFEDYMTEKEAQRFYLKRLPDGTLELKQKTNYYYQIQMALDVMEMEWCHLMVYTTKGFTIVTVQRNLCFWNEKRLRMIKMNRELVLPEFYLKRTLRHLPPVELIYSISHENCDDDFFQ